MANDTRWAKRRIVLQQQAGDPRKLFILDSGELGVIRAFQFNTDGELIALLPALEAGAAGVPGLPVERDVLGECAIAANQQV